MELTCDSGNRKTRSVYRDHHGVLTGLFFLLYAIGRIAVENFREPDSGHIGSLTKGQFYSTFMIVIGIAFLIYAFRRKRQNQIPTV